MSCDPIADLREMEASGQVTREELRDAIMDDLRARSRPELEHVAMMFRKFGRPDLAKMCLRMAATKSQLH